MPKEHDDDAILIEDEDLDKSFSILEDIAKGLGDEEGDEEENVEDRDETNVDADADEGGDAEGEEDAEGDEEDEDDEETQKSMKQKGKRKGIGQDAMGYQKHQKPKGKMLHKGKKKKKSLKKMGKPHDDDEDMQYSHADTLLGDSDVEQLTDVSDFLSGLVGKTAECMDNIHKSLSEEIENRQEGQNQFNFALAKGMKALATELAGIKKGLSVISGRPVSTFKSAVKPLEKSQGKAGADAGKTDFEKAGFASGDEAINKGLGALFDKGECQAVDIIKFESSGEINQALRVKALKEVGIGA